MWENNAFQRQIAAYFEGMDFKFSEPMAKHTSFRIGGPAQIMGFPKDEAELARMLHAGKTLSCPVYILGAGTNILAPDEGLEGLVICLKDCLDGMEALEDNRIRVMGGVTMTRAALFAAKQGLGGLEFAHGIPGTVGGGVYMNAGAYGGEICQVCTKVRIMDMDGNVRELTGEEMGFSYRHSILENQPAIVISAEFTLTPKPEQEIREQMRLLQSKRSASQPLDLPSAGSAFKRPVGGYAAALIDQAGLKGYHVADAAISTKHAGFAVNLGSATAADMKALLKEVSDLVYAQSGIRLEPEVRIW